MGLSWIETYEEIKLMYKRSKEVLYINHIEKNRKYNNTDGIIIVEVSADILDIINLLYIKEDIDIKNTSPSEIILTLSDDNNGYHINAKLYDRKKEDEEFSIDCGEFNLNEVNKILPQLIYVNGSCHDKSGLSFLIDDDDDEFDIAYIITIYKASKLAMKCLRHGIWETLNVK